MEYFLLVMFSCMLNTNYMRSTKRFEIYFSEVRKYPKYNKNITTNLTTQFNSFILIYKSHNQL